MKACTNLLGALIALSIPLAAQNATVLHYWDYEAPDAFLDKVGTADSSVTGTTTVTTGTGIRGLAAMVAPDIVAGSDDWHDIDGATLFQPGTKPFSFSYWFRIPDDSDSVPRGIFDFSGNNQDGVQSLFIDNSTNPNGQPSMAFRIDHDNGGTSLAFVGMQESPDWVFVAATFDPATALEVHVNGHGVDASAAGPGSPDPVSMFDDAYIGSFNFTGASDDKGLNGDIDDFAIYYGVLSEAEITGLFDGTLAPTDIDAPLPGPRPIGHYWDIDTLDGGTFVSIDRAGGLLTTEQGPNPVDINLDPDYGEAYTGSGWSLNTVLGGGEYLEADTYDGRATALDFGMDSFAISYWAFDHTGGALGDGDARGVMAMDCLLMEETGFQVSTDAAGNFIFRLDDDVGNSSLSVNQVGFEMLAMPADQWVCVVLNVDRSISLVEIFFDGTSQGTYSIAGLIGNIVCSQDLQLGVINGGGLAERAQKSGLDDIAIYPGILTAQQVTDLCAATTSPLDVLASFTPAGPIPIVSLDYDDTSSEVTVVFSSENGSIYSAYGDTGLANNASWPEISTGDIVGDGTDLMFKFTPAGNPTRFFLEIRED